MLKKCYIFGEFESCTKIKKSVECMALKDSVLFRKKEDLSCQTRQNNETIYLITTKHC